jgi:hypothetical protein
MIIECTPSFQAIYTTANYAPSTCTERGLIRPSVHLFYCPGRTAIQDGWIGHRERYTPGAEACGAARVGGLCMSAVGGGEDLDVGADADDGKRLGAGLINVVDVVLERSLQSFGSDGHVEIADVAYAAW